MTIFLLVIIAVLVTLLVFVEIKRRHTVRSHKLVTRLLRREIGENIDLRDENHNLQGELADALFTIEMVVKEQTKQLHDAHFNLEMVLTGKVPRP